MDKKIHTVSEQHADLIKGLTWQRERFKSAKDGTGANNFDQMCDSLENIKADVHWLAAKNEMAKEIEVVEQIIDWYRKLEQEYTKPSEEGGYKVKYPIGIEHKANKNLTIAYQVLMKIQSTLNLI